MAATAAVLDFGSERFSFFWSTSNPDASYQVSSQLAFRFRRRSKKTKFSRWRPCRPSLISDRKFLAIFDLQVPRCFLPSFKSNGISVQEKKWKLDFQDGGHLLIFDRKHFNNVWSTSHPNVSYQVSCKLAFRFRRRNEKQIFKMATTAANLNFQLDDFNHFLSIQSFKSVVSWFRRRS